MNNAPTMSVADARRVIDAALAHAEELGTQVSIAVVDAGGRVQALARMDGASFLTTALATNKAITAAGFGMPTQDFGEFAAGIPLLLTGLSGQPDVNLLPGGVPVLIDGVPAGAVGIAGGTGGEDHPIATAGIAALTPAGVAG